MSMTRSSLTAENFSSPEFLELKSETVLCRGLLEKMVSPKLGVRFLIFFLMSSHDAAERKVLRNTWLETNAFDVDTEVDRILNLNRAKRNSPTLPISFKINKIPPAGSPFYKFSNLSTINSRLTSSELHQAFSTGETTRAMSIVLGMSNTTVSLRICNNKCSRPFQLSQSSSILCGKREKRFPILSKT
jgi:hypothetical protein